MQDLKQKVLESLKTKGYHEYQLKKLNPIIQATIEATKQALNIANVSVSVAEVRQAFSDYVSTEGCSCCQDTDGHEKASNRLGELLNADQYDDESGYDWYKYATER